MSLSATMTDSCSASPAAQQRLFERTTDSCEAIRQAIGSWSLLVDEHRTAAECMRLDEKLASAGQPTIRLFRWSPPAVSFGYRQQIPDWASPHALASRGLELVERPTGGGLALHGSDVSCSIIIPADARLPLREVMRLACGSMAQAARVYGADADWLEDVADPKRVTYCLTEPSPYAIVAAGRKLGGFAIRRYPWSWLIQGSILIHPLPSAFEAVMPEEVRRAFQMRAVALEEIAKVRISDEEWVAQLVRAWRSAWDVPCFLETAGHADAV